VSWASTYRESWIRTRPSLSQPASPPVSPPVENPYVGLTHFTEEHADRFFGRDTECALIIGNLRAARLTLLYAESGVGKSSLLRAGVVARLHGFAEHDVQTRGSPRLLPVVFSSWSERPVAALIRAIGEAAGPYLAAGAKLDLPEDDLERAVERASAALGTTLLIVLDQFEEYFLYPDEELEAKRVAAQIAACVSRPDLRANFLISIREDSYARLGDLFRGKITNVYGNFLHLDFLRRAGATESIERPIERANELNGEGDQLELEPALLAAVLDQVGRGRIAAGGDGQGADGERRDEIETTYLQLVMRRLWEEETAAGSLRLRLRTLEELGGAEAIIRGHLDRAMEGTGEGGAGLSADQRRVAASIFHFLVTSGGTKIALTAKDLADLSELPVAEIEPVLRHLSSPGLHILRPVVSEDGRGQTRFEIFHDALARPIVDWRTRVEEAEIEARVVREREEKEQAQRAAAEAERRAASEQQRKRLALALLGVAVLVLLVGAAYFAIDQRNLADQRDAAGDSVRAADRIAELAAAPTFGPAAAALAGVEAYRLWPTSEARIQALEELQLNVGMPELAVGHTRQVYTVAYWPGSGLLASGGSDGTVRFWDARGEELGEPLVTPAHEVRAIAVSEASGDEGRIVVAGLWPGLVKIWRVTDSGRERSHWDLLASRQGFPLGLAFNPRMPGMLAVGYTDGRVVLWNLTNPRRPEQLATEHAPGSVTDLAFGADGRLLLVATERGGEAWRISREGFAAPGIPTENPQPYTSVATAADGSYAFGGRDRIDLVDGRGRERRLVQAGQVYSLAFARGGSVLVSAGSDGNVMTWDAASGRPFGPPRTGIAAPVSDVAVDPDGKTIASAGYDRLVKLWPLDPARTLATTVGGLSPGEIGSHYPETTSLAAGGDGYLATASGAAGTALWKLGSGTGPGAVPRPLYHDPANNFAVAYHGDLLALGRRHSFVIEDTGAGCSSMPAEPCRVAAPVDAHSDQDVDSLAFARYGDRLLLASAGYRDGEGILNLWDASDVAASGVVPHLSSRRLPGTRINQVAFSPANPLVAVGSGDGKMRVWDVSDPSSPDGIKIHHAHGNESQPVAALTFSPDGRLLASGGLDQQVVLWKVTEHGSRPLTVDATPGTLLQSQTIFSLAFSPDGKTLAAGDGDGGTCLYEVETRKAIGGSACLPGHSSRQGGIKAVAFAHVPGMGTALLTAGTAQPVVAWNPILWNLGDEDRVDQAVADDVCALARRNLTTYEWSAIFDGTNLAGDRHPTCPQYPLQK
jgi:WD40 repeat protein